MANFQRIKASLLFSLLLCLLYIKGLTAIHLVGPTQTYISPNALYIANVLQNGDTIQIDSAVYIGTPALAEWKNDNLLIQGVGGRPKLEANGQYILGKGIWVLAGNDITVENMEFSGASVPDKNGAGIRLDGIGLTVRNCFFHDNENGVLTNNPYDGDILIEYSEFAGNGFGDGFSHNLYIGHVNKLTFQYNYSHHTNIGHNLKSRADENYILYNRIMDEETGNSSRLIDVSNGGLSIIMGNLLMQGTEAENNNLIGYGREGLSNTAPHELYVIHNSCVNKRVASCIFVDIENGTTIANVSNNIFAGTGTPIQGITTANNTNLVETNIANIDFVNESNYNYRIQSASPAVDYGTSLNPVNGFSLTPANVYSHLAKQGDRTIENAPDAGAYELLTRVSISDLSSEMLSLYPNPTTGIFTLSHDSHSIKKLHLIDLWGREVFSSFDSKTVDISHLPSGIYFLQVELRLGQFIIKKLMKE